MTHPSDEQLAAFVDDDSNDGVAEIAAHVAQCARCEQQVTALRGVVGALRAGPQPSVVDAVLRRIETPSWWSRWRVPTLAASSCAVIAGLIIVRAPTPTTTTPTTDVFVARGGNEAPRVLYLLNDGQAVIDGAEVAAGSSWRADLQADGDAIAVVAVDVDGAVHWLRPTWTDAARPPSCPAPLAATMSIATETVAFALPTGPLVVRALRVPRTCDVPGLDAALGAGGTGGAVVVDEVRVMVRP